MSDPIAFKCVVCHRVIYLKRLPDSDYVCADCRERGRGPNGTKGGRR